MGFYERVVFPTVADVVMSAPALTGLRKKVLAEARGHVLEVGLGSGLNLPCYPSAVTRVTGVDPNEGMNRLALRRAARAPFPVEVRALAGERLPFDDTSVDTVVGTFVLCTIPGVEQALSEMRRVLRPEGRLLVLEHGLHPRPGVQAWQRRLTPMQQVVACGCRLDRDVRALVEGAGFRWEWIEHREAPGPAAPYGFLTLGAAR